MNDQFNQTGEFTFFYPPLAKNITITFQDCTTSQERFIKVNRIIKLYNFKMIRITNDINNDTINTTHNNLQYFNSTVSLNQFLKTNVNNLL
jgi:hypothetical protein